MATTPGIRAAGSDAVAGRSPADAGRADISTDLSWLGMLRGMAIIGVFSENCLNYVKHVNELNGFAASVPAVAGSVASAIALASGPFVQVFFIVSGFGLTLSYLKHGRTGWSWRAWSWRRVTKIVVPYEVAIVAAFALGLLATRLFGSPQMQFSWESLLANMTFLRNFYPPAWNWNPPLWFMPIIIGLYVSFPVMLRILERWGPRALLLISIAVTFGTLAIGAAVRGPEGGHETDVFAFWVFQFALGMVLAYQRQKDPRRLRLLLGIRPFLVGLGALALSYLLRVYVPFGKAFNDPVTSIGVFLVLLNVGWAVRAWVPAIGRAFDALSGQSYLMYLLHMPIWMFLLVPLLPAPIHPLLGLVLLAAFVPAMYWLCRAISVPMGGLTPWLSGTPRAASGESRT